MNCQRCNSTQLEPRRVYRMSGCLVALGFGLLAFSAAAVAGGILLTVAGTALTGVAGAAAADEVRTESVRKLKSLPGVPVDVVHDFERDGKIDDRRLADLPPEQRRQIQEIETQYHLAIGGAAAAAGCFGCLGGIGVIVLFVASVPALIVGLLLVLKK